MNLRWLPIAPVKQRAADDVEVTVTFANGCVETHYYRPGAVEWLTARYSAPTAESGLNWQVTVTRSNSENGA